MSRITPCLWFGGQAEEAATFYVSLLPDSRIEKVLRSPAAYPGGAAGSVLTVDFTLAGQPFIALNGRSETQFNDAVSFMIDCEDQAEVDRLWDALIAGGGAPIMCGWLKDRYGVRWQIVPTIFPVLMADPDPEKARRAMEAMMKMVKLDIAEILRATNGAPPA